MDIGTHHLHLRKRLYKNLEEFPNKEPLKRFFDYLMYGVGIISPFALLPQVERIYMHHDVSGLSVATWSMLALINVLWAVYGVLHKEYPIILGNIGFMLLNVAVVVGIFLFR